MSIHIFKILLENMYGFRHIIIVVTVQNSLITTQVLYFLIKNPGC